jgi:hypothetical protein
MIWLLAHPLPPPGKLDRRHIHGKTEKYCIDELLTEGREGAGEERNHTNAKKPGPL